ncbi:MAG: WD40 repeat domain-containing protein [Chloroflexota bacterium]
MIRTLLVIFVMMLGLNKTLAQTPASPFLHTERQVITPENVMQLVPAAEIGKGLLIDALWLENGALAVITTRGVYLYPAGDLTATPDLIAYEPNPFAARYASFEAARISMAGDVIVILTMDGSLAVDTATGQIVPPPDDAETVDGEATPEIVTGTRRVVLETNEETNRVDIVVRDSAGGDELARIPNVACTLRRNGASLLYHQADETLYVVSKPGLGGTIRAWDFSGESPELIGEVLDFRNSINDVTFSPDGSTLYMAQGSQNPICNGSATGDSVAQYDMMTGQLTGYLPLDGDYMPHAVAINSDGDMLVGGLRVVAYRPGDAEGFTVAPVESPFNTSTVIADDGTPYAYVNGSIVQLNASGAVEQVFAEDLRSDIRIPGWGRGIAVTDDLLIYMGLDNTVLIRDRATNTLRQTLTFDRQVNGIVYDAASGLLGVHTGNGRLEGTLNTVEFFRIASQGEGVEPVGTADIHTANRSLNLSPGGALLATTHTAGDASLGSLDIGPSLVHFYDTATGERLGGFSDFYVQYPVRFSPDGTYLVISGGGGNLLVYALP